MSYFFYIVRTKLDIYVFINTIYNNNYEFSSFFFLTHQCRALSGEVKKLNNKEKNTILITQYV
jgi:hypothetical protein